VTRDLATDLLDILGLLLIAAGVGFAAAGVWRLAAVGVSGCVVVAGSLLMARLGRPRQPSRPG